MARRRHNLPSDPRARSNEAFIRIDRAILRRNIGPLLLVAVLFVLTLKGMPLARLLTRAGVPGFWVRLPIAIFGAIYYARVLLAAVELTGNLLKRKSYNHYR
jgi:hypothetical protein